MDADELLKSLQQEEEEEAKQQQENPREQAAEKQKPEQGDRERKPNSRRKQPENSKAEALPDNSKLKSTRSAQEKRIRASDLATNIGKSDNGDRDSSDERGNSEEEALQLGYGNIDEDGVSDDELGHHYESRAPFEKRLRVVHGFSQRQLVAWRQPSLEEAWVYR